MNKVEAREALFRHLDGVVVIPVVAALHQRNVIAQLIDSSAIEVDGFAEQVQANAGYLNVALRILASQGYLTYQVENSADTVRVQATPNAAFLVEQADIYTDLAAFLSELSRLTAATFLDDACTLWVATYAKYKSILAADYNDQPEWLQLQKHIEGCLIAPLIVRLGMSGMFHNYFMQSSFTADEFHKNPACFHQVLLALADLGWFSQQNGHFEFTELGLFFAKRATAYGVTVSYLPMFAKLPDLLYGNPSRLRELAEGEDERHVDREMNVWGSGGAHSNYFKVIDELIIELFNRPIEQQPKGILDMGCGNGALLQHLYEVIERYTLRGKLLEDYPLFLVGADYNQAALKVTRANLIKNDIWAKVIWGDISDPDTLARDLRENYKIELGDLLNMRTFLDHNRIWEPTESGATTSDSTGAFAYRGARLSNNAVQENLTAHLRKWKPYVAQYGLLLIELHTLAPELVAKNLGKTPATAYDATHGFSDQYIVEVAAFHQACADAGLPADPAMFKRFPNSELATVSINLLKAPVT